MIDKEMLDSMREFAKEDTYRGAVYETIMRLCDEIELLKAEVREYRDHIMFHSRGIGMVTQAAEMLDGMRKSVHGSAKKPQDSKCYSVVLVARSDKSRLPRTETVGVCTEDAARAVGVAWKSVLEGKGIDTYPILVEEEERI